MKNLLTIICLIALPSFGNSQCFSGAIGASGAGCGCLAGCNLVAVGGPDCGAGGTGGNCTGGYQSFFVDIIVPDGCTYTVTATMMNRPGCSASGADGNCQGCDNVKVDIPGGPKIFQQGGGNSTLNDSYVLAGPGTIRVSGSANRADEIVTYDVFSGGPFCIDCSSILSVNLLDFSAEKRENGVDIQWSTKSETNNSYFSIEKSRDGIIFSNFYTIAGQGNSNNYSKYNILDSEPFVGINYYRLKETDINGKSTYSRMVSAYFDNHEYFEIYPNPAQKKFTVRAKNLKAEQISVINSVGARIEIPVLELSDRIEFDSSSLEAGVYYIQVNFKAQIETKKLIVY